MDVFRVVDSSLESLTCCAYPLPRCVTNRRNLAADGTSSKIVL